jgi:hypothetical protein
MRVHRSDGPAAIESAAAGTLAPYLAYIGFDMRDFGPEMDRDPIGEPLPGLIDADRLQLRYGFENLQSGLDAAHAHSYAIERSPGSPPFQTGPRGAW